MAQIWMDEENAGAHMLPRSARKAMGDNTLQQSGKKSVLSKLDNVMYNKPNLTPFKGANTKWPLSCAPKLSLCKETLQKQHRSRQPDKDSPQLLEAHFKAPQVNVATDLYAKSADPAHGFDLFDFMDFPTAQCMKNCQKPISRECLEPMLNEDLIAKLLNHSLDTAEEETVYDMPDYPDLDADIYALKPREYNNIHESENKLADLFEVRLPANIFMSDFEKAF
ncbi:uncharacterized protein pim [Drosophila virilis]|uniref:Uncharacterized protein n=1 Tax=Drosophila virilis TaxID=7244 RepID=B4M9R8_DROVI|nr:uncharacterized protein LOC6634069 [Drosophila virilis]EDW57944.2 uncharacterized protein Dvir_GJ18371 [Drosophila virilis]